MTHLHRTGGCYHAGRDLLLKVLIDHLELAPPTGEAAAQAYPSRPLTMVVPYPAGGPTDCAQLAPRPRYPLGLTLSVSLLPGLNAVSSRPLRHLSCCVGDRRMLISFTSSAGWR